MIEEFAKLVVERTTSFTQGTNLFLGHLEEENPDDGVFILEQTPSGVDGFLADRLDKMFQILTRSVSYFTARDWAFEIYTALHVKWGVEMSGITPGVAYMVEVLESIASPYYLGPDEKNRHVFTCNFVLKLQDYT